MDLQRFANTVFKEWMAVKTRIKSGAAEGIRTPNPRITSAALFR